VPGRLAYLGRLAARVAFTTDARTSERPGNDDDLMSWAKSPELVLDI
jgi:hypothetical protein